MKNILKSVVTIGALSAMMFTATGAYFSSTVVAEDNEINTGTLLVAVDTAQEDSYVGTWGTPNAYNVIRQNVDTTTTQNGNFITWDNAAPGETQTYTVGIRNNGTIPFKFQSSAAGEWVAGPAFGSCGTDLVDADASLVSVTNVHQYAATAGGGCEGDIGCRNLRDGLVGLGGWTPVAGLTAGDSGAVAGHYYGALDGGGDDDNAPVLIGEDEFAIYQIEVTLSDTADNCYQGATYEFDLGVEGYQEADPVF